MSALVVFWRSSSACHPERAKRVKGSLSIHGGSAVFEQRNSLGAIAILFGAARLRMTWPMPSAGTIGETLAAVSGKARKKFRPSSECAHFR